MIIIRTWRMDIRDRLRQMIINLSLFYSLLLPLCILHPRTRLLAIRIPSPGNWAVQRLESVAEILARIHPWRKDGSWERTDNTRSIYEREKMEKKNSRDIIVTRLSFDFILPNHYCPSARHSRVKRYWKKCWRWTLITFPHGRSNALHA